MKRLIFVGLVLLCSTASAQMQPRPSGMMPYTPPPTVGFVIQSITLTPENYGRNDGMYNALVNVSPIGQLPGISYFQPLNIQIPHLRSLDEIRERVKPEVDKAVSSLVKKLEEDKEAFDKDHH